MKDGKHGACANASNCGGGYMANDDEWEKMISANAVPDIKGDCHWVLSDSGHAHDYTDNF